MYMQLRDCNILLNDIHLFLLLKRSLEQGCNVVMSDNSRMTVVKVTNYCETEPQVRERRRGFPCVCQLAGVEEKERESAAGAVVSILREMAIETVLKNLYC